MRPNVTSMAITLLGALMGITACGQDPVEVGLTIIIPASVKYDRVRIVKLGRSLSATEKAYEPGFGGGRSHTAGVLVPDGSEVSVLVQAGYEGRLVAQRTLVVDSSLRGGTVQIELLSCTGAALTDEPATCDSGTATSPGERDGGPDQPDAGPPDVSPDQVPEGGPGAACMTPDPGSLPPAPPALLVSQPCLDYCQLMGANCPAVYESPDQCQQTCAKLAWPVGAPDLDTVTCRMDWARQAADPKQRIESCDKASLFTRMACGGRPCEQYCRSGAIVCPAHFPYISDCRIACQQRRMEFLRDHPQGDFDASLLMCRFLRLQKAIFDPRLCSSAAPVDCPGDCLPLVFTP